MAYELADFCGDCHRTLSDSDDPNVLLRVRDQLARLLANDTFVERVFGVRAPPGLHRLYEDGELGFQVLAHANTAPRENLPHNHGVSWAVYGQATGYTEMTEYRRIDDYSDPHRATLEVIRRYRLQPGDVGVYARGVTTPSDTLPNPASSA